MLDRYHGQCFCYPEQQVCTHCNRARMWLDRDVLVLANELAEHIMTTDESAFDSLENIYDQETDEPQEIMQWYIVSKWLAEKLAEQGEPVADWHGQYFWGRTCCGQGVELDGTFQQISRSLDK